MNNLLLFFQGGGGLGSFSFLLPLLAMGGIFYFLVILPQKKQKQQLQDLITNLKINDEIVTSGGLIGTIKETRENSFIILSAEKSFIEIGKQAVIGKKAE